MSSVATMSENVYQKPADAPVAKPWVSPILPSLLSMLSMTTPPVTGGPLSVDVPLVVPLVEPLALPLVPLAVPLVVPVAEPLVPLVVPLLPEVPELEGDEEEQATAQPSAVTPMMLTAKEVVFLNMNVLPFPRGVVLPNRRISRPSESKKVAEASISLNEAESLGSADYRGLPRSARA